MALRFNPPPSWPKPPEGFTPQPGWRPDPSWGPAPEGWVFWTEDEDGDATRVLPTDSVAEKTSNEDPTEVFGSAEPTLPMNPYAEAHQLLQNYAEQKEEETDASQSEQTSAASSGRLSQEGSNAQSNQQGSYSQGSYSQNSYAQGSYSQNTPAYDVSSQAPAQKKSKKFLWIGLAVALVFLLALFFVVLTAVKSFSGSSASNDTSISQQDTGSDTWADNSGSSSGDFSRDNASGETKTYEGTGNKTLDIEKPGGDNSTAWVEFTYTPTDEYDNLDITQLSPTGETNGSLVTNYGGATETYTGSAFIDGQMMEGSPTKKLAIVGEGEWKLVVHPLDDTPVKKAGDTISGDSSQAFIVDSSGTTADFKFSDGDDAGAHFSLDMMPDVLSENTSTTLIESGYPGLSASVAMPEGKHLYLVESWTGIPWEATFS